MQHIAILALLTICIVSTHATGCEVDEIVDGDVTCTWEIDVGEVCDGSIIVNADAPFRVLTMTESEHIKFVEGNVFSLLEDYSTNNSVLSVDMDIRQQKFTENVKVVFRKATSGTYHINAVVIGSCNNDGRGFSTVGIVLGAIGVAAAFVGLAVGGVYINRWRNNRRQTTATTPVNSV